MAFLQEWNGCCRIGGRYAKVKPMGRDLARPMHLSARPAFIDINRSVSAGLSIKGGGWNRPDDVLGVGRSATAFQRRQRPTSGPAETAS
jgi:hypothetical protein